MRLSGSTQYICLPNGKQIKFFVAIHHGVTYIAMDIWRGKAAFIETKHRYYRANGKRIDATIAVDIVEHNPRKNR